MSQSGRPLSLKFILLAVVVLLCGGSSSGATLEEILSHIDQVGKDLRSMEASLVQKKWTDILSEYDSGEKGTFLFLKDGDKALLRKEIVAPTVNSLVIKDGTVTFFQPSLKQAQQYKLGKNGDKAEFLLLGFGTDKDALRATYNITLLGEETLDGTKAYKIELKPKSDRFAAFFVQIILWIDAERWIPIQQQLVEPTLDHLLITFSNIQLNPKISKSRFDLKLPRDVNLIKN
jgi:outer membrane lipoprotein-sorting protein